MTGLRGRIDYYLNRSGRGGAVIAGLIILSVGLVVLATELPNEPWIEATLYLIGVIFFAEYCMRIWIAPLSFPDKARPRLHYLLSVNGVIDLIAALPVFIGPLVQGTTAIRALRLLRLAQLLKVRRIRTSVLAVMSALKESWDELVFSFILSLSLIMIGATAMYFVEGQYQPEAFGSIPRAMWWSMATLTTVGYGDVYPQTALGKVIASFLALVGIAAVAMPAGILAAAFSDGKKLRDDAFDSDVEIRDAATMQEVHSNASKTAAVNPGPSK